MIHRRIIAILTMFFCLALTGTALAADKPAEVIRFAAMGDIMLGTVGLLPENDGRDSFKAVVPHLAGRDIVFGNQESALADVGACPKTGPGTYCFRTPTSYARVYKDAGFNMLSIANNHVNDFGPQAKAQMIATLEKNGLQYSGPVGTVARVTVRGVRVAMIAFHHAGSGSHAVEDLDSARKQVGKLVQTDDLVMVSFHGGAEGPSATHIRPGGERFMGEYRGDLMTFSRAMVDVGADLVVGHGPHVPRAMEVYKDRLIAYSLGNFCTHKGISVKGISGYATLLLADLDVSGRLAGGRIVSFIQPFGQHPQLDKENRAARLVYDLGRQDLPQSTAVNADGSLIAPKAGQ